MWICILHLPRHPKTQSAQFTFFTANRFWALGLLGFAFRGSGILRTERVTGPSWDHQFAAKQRPIFERAQRAGSEVSRMIPHDFSWFLMISHDFSLVRCETFPVANVEPTLTKCGLSPCWSMLARPLHDVFEWSQRPRRPRRRIA